mgnify:CR=1 FL=1
MAKNIVLRTKLKGAEKTKRGLKGIDSGIRNLGMSALKLGGTFFAAQGIISGFKAVVSAAGKQELAEKKLEASLGRTSEALLSQARALQQVSMFGDEAIIEAQALIAAFVDDEEAIKKATQATLDLAAAKGMDLTAAADLVSKTLGSSTNAMSRYGIEVTGAVGSTERLDTLTGNIADKFGGQASAQAQTMTGALEQMKNALGDVAEEIGESLSPLVIGMAKGIKSLATEEQTHIDVLKKEKIEFAGLIKILQDTNAHSNTRITAIETLQNKYSGYISNIDLETASYEELQTAIGNANTEFLEKIRLTAAENQLKEEREKVASATKTLVDLELEWAEKKAELDAQTAKGHQNWSRQIDLTKAYTRQINEAKEAVELAEGNWRDLYDRLVLIGALPDDLLPEDLKPDNMEGLVTNTNDYALSLRDVNEQLTLMKVKMEEVEQPSLNLSNSLEFLNSEQKFLVNTTRQLSSNFASAALNGQKMGDAVVSSLKAIAAELIANYAIYSLLNYFTGGTFGAGKSFFQFAFAEHGMDQVVTKPTMIMTGEGNKAERVSVTPLESPNINGPQGGITLNISAPLVDDTVIDTIIPAIQKAQRLNLA